MDRRNFLKISTASWLGLQACGHKEEHAAITFDLSIHSDLARGHRVFQGDGLPKGEVWETEVLVVGGGMAGLSAAANLSHQDFLLCELSDRLGGSSSAHQYQKTTFSQGAHYELTYPDYFGEEVLGFLEKLDIIRFNEITHKWDYRDHLFLIPPKRESQCFDDGAFRMEVLPDEGYDAFFEFADPLTGKLKLPTRNIDPNYHHLGDESFQAYLRRHIQLPEKFYQGLDYHMIDDFGGASREVSALAGMYYYVNRPYETAEHEVFSPPEGNFYFAQKIIDTLPPGQLLTGHLVSKIAPASAGFVAEVMDLDKGLLHQVKANQIVFAGHKHALKHIFPEVYPPFSGNVYAPWVVLNFVLPQAALPKGFWQNEFLDPERSFMGFVDSDAQYNPSGQRTLTAYYCFPPWQRDKVMGLEGAAAQQLVRHTVGHMARYFGMEAAQLGQMVEKVFMKPMGHAMPVPVPGYLLKDKNQNRPYPNLTFAGVDNARLPLLFEALDSGICAAKLLG